jgi:hypothetical protein
MVRLFDDRLGTHHYDTKNEISAVEKKDLQEGDLIHEIGRKKGQVQKR